MVSIGALRRRSRVYCGPPTAAVPDRSSGTNGECIAIVGNGPHTGGSFICALLCDAGQKRYLARGGYERSSDALVTIFLWGKGARRRFAACASVPSCAKYRNPSGIGGMSPADKRTVAHRRQ